MANCEVCTILPQNDPAFSLYDGQYWQATVRDTDQTLLGTTFITAKRHVPELDYLTPEEDSEFIVIRNGVIQAIRNAFEPLTFNVSCLKNDAFKHDPDHARPEDAHVHWHIKPRYGTEPVLFNGEVFQDPMPGRYLSQFERHRPSRTTAVAIADTLRRHVSL